MMRVLRGTDGIDRDLHIPARTIFKTDRTRETAGKLPMALALGCAGANGAPADQIGDVLRRDQVQIFSGGGEAHAIDIQQQLARAAQAFVDVERVVEVRIVDEAFPTNRGTGFLEIHTHHHKDIF